MVGGLPGVSSLPGGRLLRASVPYYNKDRKTHLLVLLRARLVRGPIGIDARDPTSPCACVPAAAASAVRSSRPTSPRRCISSAAAARCWSTPTIRCPATAPSLLGLDRTKSLADLSPIAARLTPELLESYLITSASRHHGAAVRHRLPAASPPDTGLIQAVLEVARVAYDTVVVDLPTEGPGAVQTVLDQTDVTCVVGGAVGDAAACAPASTLDLLRALQFPLERVIGCANRVTDRAGAAPIVRRPSAACRFAPLLPDDPHAVRDAASRRQPIVLADPRHAISREIDRLSRDILTTSTRQLTSGERDVDDDDIENVDPAS